MLQCLVLDHDDTVFNSGYAIHYQAFLKSLEAIKPQLPKPSFQEFTRANFHLGFSRMCQELYSFTPSDMHLEYTIWKDYVRTHQAHPFDGFKPLLQEYKKRGGYLVVASFSERREIQRDYQTFFGLSPDLIFAYDTHRTLMKPHPFAVEESCRQLHLSPNDVLVVDDSPVGYYMAQAAKAHFRYATWAHDDPILLDYIETLGETPLTHPNQLHDLLFG